MKKLVIFVFGIFLIIFNFVNAEPQITNVNGIFSHKNDVTIYGSGFGLKNPVPPKIWDWCDDSSPDSLDIFYPGDRYPRPCANPSETPFEMAYRRSFHGFSEMPHSRITKFISGAAVTCNGEWASEYANNLITTDSWDADTLFLTYYYRMSPTWTIETSPYGDNLKEVSANGCEGNLCGTYLNGRDTYIGWCGSQTPILLYPSNAYMRGANVDGIESCASGNYVSIPNPMSKWTHLEVYWDNYNGYKVGYSDGVSTNIASNWVRKYLNDASGSNAKTISIGGFTRWPRLNDTGNYRYWAGIYADNTYARIMLGNNPNWASSTIREPQIPSSWSDNSITFTVNLGALPDTGIAYLFVFDSNNTHNAVGYPVTLGGQSQCSNGQTRSCNTGQQGICSLGTQTCLSGVWSSCVRNQNPTTEICGDNIDQDCDGFDLNCSNCQNGQITSRCICEGLIRDSGYCCNNSYQIAQCNLIESCPVQLPQGMIACEDFNDRDVSSPITYYCDDYSYSLYTNQSSYEGYSFRSSHTKDDGSDNDCIFSYPGAREDREFFIRYRIRYDTNYEWGSNPNVKILKFSGFNNQDLEGGWTGIINNTPTCVHIYMMNDHGSVEFNDWCSRLKQAALNGEWHTVEYYIKRNNPNSEKNGIFKMWIDGFLVMNYTNLSYYNSSNWFDNAQHIISIRGQGTPDRPSIGRGWWMIDKIEIWDYIPTLCPNSICEQGETCLNCPADCGVCPSLENITTIQDILNSYQKYKRSEITIRDFLEKLKKLILFR